MQSFAFVVAGLRLFSGGFIFIGGAIHKAVAFAIDLLEVSLFTLQKLRNSDYNTPGCFTSNKR